MTKAERDRLVAYVRSEVAKGTSLAFVREHLTETRLYYWKIYAQRPELREEATLWLYTIRLCQEIVGAT